MHCFQYVTGTGPKIETKTKGEYKIILPDGTEVMNMSKKNRTLWVERYDILFDTGNRAWFTAGSVRGGRKGHRS